VKQKKITSLELGPGAEYNYAVVKKLCGQGLLYVKVKEGYEFVYEEDGSDDKILDDDKLLSSAGDDDKPLTSTADDYNDYDKDLQASVEIDNTDEEAISVSKTVLDEIVDIITTKNLSDPVELLRLLQQKLIKGRKLDVTNIDLIVGLGELEKSTNYICVDRQNILKTTFAELESIEDFCLTFEIDFMGEVATAHECSNEGEIFRHRSERVSCCRILLCGSYDSRGITAERSVANYYAIRCNRKTCAP
jgi:hypothetical protein